MNQLQTILDKLESFVETDDGCVNVEIMNVMAIIHQMMRTEPVAWAYEGEPSFDGTKWHTKIEVTTSFQLAKFKSGTIKKPIPLYAAPKETK